MDKRDGDDLNRNSYKMHKELKIVHSVKKNKKL